MNKYLIMKQIFEDAQDPENAVAMSEYMKNKFAFYGIAASKRRELYKDFLKDEKAAKTIDRAFLEQCYKDEHREFQYLVYDYLLAMKRYVVFEDIDMIQTFVTTKPWWDTVDFLSKVVGNIGLKDPRIGELMLTWSDNENIWLKRTSLLHQLAYKDKTDTSLLEKIIMNCTGSDEFFVNKAIGWALREYSKTDPQWVRDFIGKNENSLNKLSIKEAGKYI